MAEIKVDRPSRVGRAMARENFIALGADGKLK